MRELGGPIVDWIFVTCVVMWCIAIERFWYFNRILPRETASALADWRQRTEHTQLELRDRSAKRSPSAYRNVSARSAPLSAR